MSIIAADAVLHEAHRENHTHRDVNGGWLRPAVFGAMDGLVSNLALMTGVAGGAVSQQTIVITGLAGLAAGAFSMAAGEYTSVASQRELVEAELAVERRELRKHPKDEMAELAALDESRRVDAPLAREVARQLSTSTRSRHWRSTPARNRASSPAGRCPSTPPSHRHHRGRRDQGVPRRRAALPGVAGDRRDPAERPARACAIVHTHASVTRRQQTFGYTEEELRVILAPMARTAGEPLAPWAPTRPSPRSPSARACSSTTSPSSSRRSPTRRWTPSARNWSPRCAPRSAPRATSWSRPPPRPAASRCPSR
ncbi:hypothetical protein SBADM41S_12000 [Streptomyces badius]